MEGDKRKKFNSWSKVIGVNGLFLIIFVFLIGSFWLLEQSGYAQAATGINRELSYQGKIADSAGNSLATGNYNFKFEIYSTLSGGSPLWTEEWKTGSTAGQVTVTHGGFNVDLGQGVSLGSLNFNDDSLYLQIYLDADGNGSYEEVFAPRKRLTAAPYAMNADQLDGFHASTTATANTIPVLNNDAGLSVNNLNATSITLNGSTIVSWPTGDGGVETDPVFATSAAATISSSSITNWNTAYSWGNHAVFGYLTTSTASSTYGALVLNNIWTGLNTFSGVSSTNATVTNMYLNGITPNSFLAVNAQGKIVVTSTPTGGGAPAWDQITGSPPSVSYFSNDANYITSGSIPSNVSYFNNDANYITYETDPGFRSWSYKATVEANSGNWDNVASWYSSTGGNGTHAAAASAIDSTYNGVSTYANDGSITGSGSSGAIWSINSSGYFSGSVGSAPYITGSGGYGVNTSAMNGSIYGANGGTPTWSIDSVGTASLTGLQVNGNVTTTGLSIFNRPLRIVGAANCDAIFGLRNNNAPLNAKEWQFTVDNAGTLYLQTPNDNLIGASTLFSVTRSGAVPTLTTWMYPINFTGNVGIGTSTPAYKLDVVGDIRIGNNLYGSSSGLNLIVPTDYNAMIGGGNLSLTAGDGFGNTSGVNDGGSVIITAGSNTGGLSGSVSLSTGVDEQSLHSGDMNLTTASNVGFFFSPASSGNINIGTGSSHYGVGDVTIKTGNSATWHSGNILLLPGTGGSLYGNVGIGTNGPVAKLDINNPSANEKSFRVSYSSTSEAASIGTESWNGYLSLSQGGGGGEQVRIRTSGITYFNGGKVGIGTTNPDGYLHIATPAVSASEQIALVLGNKDFSAGAMTDLSFQIGTDGTSERYTGAIKAKTLDATTGELQFWTDNSGLTQKMVIQSNGNVGIGTTNPGAKLDISGTTSDAVTSIIRDGGVAGAGLEFVSSGAGGRSYTIISTATSAGAGSGKLGFYDNISGGYRMVLDKSGNVGIGTTTPQFSLTLASTTATGVASMQIARGGLCVDNDGWCNASTTGRVSAVSYTTGNSDLAENYPAIGLVEKGDIVAVDQYQFGYGVKIASKDERIFGAISEAPAIILGLNNDAPRESDVPVALTGRVPVKVSNENGPIKVGDYIRLSSVPGVGMKATASGEMVGIALESFDGSNSTGKIMVFIKVGYAEVGTGSQSLKDSQLQVSTSNNNKLETLSVSQQATFYGTITVIGEANFTAKVTFAKDVEVKGKLYVTGDQVGVATLPAGVTSTEIKFKSPYDVAPIVTLTPRGNIKNHNYWVFNESTSSFSIAIDSVMNSTFEFNWQAFATRDNN